METRVFEVMIRALLIARRLMPAALSAREARSLLIAEGLSSEISVYKLAPGGARCEDCARATHPEEIA